MDCHNVLPEGQVLTLTLCNINTGTATSRAQRCQPRTGFRLGPHAVDAAMGRCLSLTNVAMYPWNLAAMSCPSQSRPSPDAPAMQL